MRLPDTSFILDVQAIEKNPIVLKRKKAQQERYVWCNSIPKLISLSQ